MPMNPLFHQFASAVMFGLNSLLYSLRLLPVAAQVA